MWYNRHVMTIPAPPKVRKPPEMGIERRLVLLERFHAYVDVTDMPLIAEFCALEKVSRRLIYEWPEFDDARDFAIAKKEAYILRKGLHKELDSSLCKFVLTGQCGWKSPEQTLVHVGANGGPVATVDITAGMTPEEASEAYLKFAKGVP